MGPPNADIQKVHLEWHVLHGHNVRDLFILPTVLERTVQCTDRTYRICAITGVRIKVTTEINSPDPQVQWALNALLVNLEVTLGITNACLPVLKPVFNRLGNIRPFTTLLTWSSQWKLRKNSDASSHGILSLGRNQNGPSRIRRDSYHKFSDDSSPDGQVQASKSSTSQLLQSKPYYPQKKWGNGSLEMATRKAGQVITQIDGGHHRGI